MSVNADNERDRVSLPDHSWWLGLSREQLREAVEQREAARMRHSRIGQGGGGSARSKEPPKPRVLMRVRGRI